MQTQMFEVSKYSVCSASGSVDVELVFDTPRGVRTETKHFCTAQVAERYLDKARANYITIKFADFVKHKKIIFSSGKQEYYNVSSKRYALDRCISTLNYIKALKRTGDICRNILKVQHDLELIMPAHTNSSYISSIFKKDEIISFCIAHSTGQVPGMVNNVL